MKVILTNQSFAEAGGLNTYPDLEIVGIIETITYNQQDSYEGLISSAYETMRKKAAKQKITHIFSIQHFPFVHIHKHSSYGQDFRIIGTGYKKREKKRDN